jgi:hypothetical protein
MVSEDEPFFGLNDGQEKQEYWLTLMGSFVPQDDNWAVSF